MRRQGVLREPPDDPYTETVGVFAPRYGVEWRLERYRYAFAILASKNAPAFEEASYALVGKIIDYRQVLKWWALTEADYRRLVERNIVFLRMPRPVLPPKEELSAQVRKLWPIRTQRRRLRIPFRRGEFVIHLAEYNIVSIGWSLLSKKRCDPFADIESELGTLRRRFAKAGIDLAAMKGLDSASGQIEMAELALESARKTHARITDCDAADELVQSVWLVTRILTRLAMQLELAPLEALHRHAEQLRRRGGRMKARGDPDARLAEMERLVAGGMPVAEAARQVAAPLANDETERRRLAEANRKLYRRRHPDAPVDKRGRRKNSDI